MAESTGISPVIRIAGAHDRDKEPIEDWLAVFEKRLKLAKAADDEEKILLCSISIGPTGRLVMATVPEGDDATWAQMKTHLKAKLQGDVD